MDFDPRGDDRFGSMKLAARTDLVSFPLKMAANFGSNNAGPMTNNMAAGGGVSLVRSNSMAGQPDNNNNNGRALGAGGAGCSPTTSSTTSDGCALLGNDGSYANMQHEQQEAAAMRSYIMSSSSCGRSMNAEALAMASYMGNAQRAMGLYNQGHGANYMMMAAGGGVVHDGDLMAQAANIFTASQLRELQLHALIFKHLMCGVNVPPELSLPIRTSVAASLGWGHFHLGYGGNSFDPEPGRCRRTDGKKWRCSRDVVPDQKYCERHMHRGRHRARKLAPEAGQLGANTNTAATNSAASVNPSSTTGMPNSSMPSGIPCASGGGGASRSGGGQLPPVSGHSTPGNPLRHAATSSFINPGGGGGGGGHQMSGHATGGSGGALSIASATAASFPNQPHHHHHQFGGGGTSTTTPPPSTRPDLRYVCGTDLGSQEPGTFFSDARGLSLESPSSLSSGMSGSAAGAINEPSLMMRSVMQSKQQQQQQEQAQSFLGAFDDNSAGGRESDQAGQPLRHFFDDWPRSRPDTASSTGLAWPADDDDDGVMDPSLVDDDNDQHRAHRGSSSTTQLSISMPIGCQVDRFGGSGAASPSNGSSPRGKLAGPALKLSMMSSSSSNASGQATGGPGDQLEAAATHMGLGVGTLQANEEEVAAAIIQHEQPRSEEGVFLAGRPGAAMSWVPIAWGGRNHHHHHHDHHNSGNSGAGGPLAEALHNSSNNSTPRGQPASTKNQNHHHNGGGAGSSGAPLNLMGGGPTGRTEQGGWHTDNCTTTSPTAPGQMQYSTSRAPGSGSGSGLAPGSGSGSGSASPRHHRR